MDLTLNKDVMGVELSGIRQFTYMVRDTPGACALTIGEPDLNTPDVIKEAAKAALDANDTHYPPGNGYPYALEAISRFEAEAHDLHYSPSEIILTVGATEALFASFSTILNPGDEVIIPAPYWLSYAEMVRLAGGTPVVVYTKQEEDFALTREVLESGYSDKTKAVIITTPSNPTGMVMTEKQLREIADFAVEKDIIVIADEIYEKLIYSDDKKHVSIASFGKEIYDRTITVNGVSKSYAMTGWRIGYTASSLKIAKLMSSMQSHMTSGPNSIAQKAALAAIAGPQDCVEDMRKEFEKRRDYIYDRVAKMPYVKTLKPEGAFYLFVDFSGTYGKTYKGEKLESAAQIGALLLDEALIAVVPCADFGMPDHIRFSYATSLENIKTGMDRLEKFLEEIK